MMNVSDNTATVMLADKVGVEAMETRMNKWGLKGTACTINVPASNARLTKLRADFRNMGVTTPADMGRLLELIHLRKTGASPAASERMIRMMNHQYWDDFFASVLPPNIVVCSKVGALERSRSDTAIVYGPTPYVITAYTDDAKDRTWANNNEGHVALRKLSATVWKALNPGHPYTPPKGDDLWFPTGAGVEGD
jgi:beta-lactamase class A